MPPTLPTHHPPQSPAGSLSQVLRYVALRAHAPLSDNPQNECVLRVAAADAWRRTAVSVALLVGLGAGVAGLYYARPSFRERVDGAVARGRGWLPVGAGGRLRRGA